MVKSFQERFRSKPENAAKTVKATVSKRIPRSTNWFTKIHDVQMDTTLRLGLIAFALYAILAREHRRHHGQAFELKIGALVTLDGLSERNLRRTLHQLENCDLISVQRNPPKPHHGSGVADPLYSAKFTKLLGQISTCTRPNQHL